MKIAFCIFKYYPYGGLEREFTRIMDVCQQHGHVIEVFTMHWQGAIPENIKVTLVPVHGFTNHGRAACFVKNVTHILKSANYDAIFGVHRMPGLDVYYAPDICFEYDIRQRHGWLYRLTPRYKTYSAFERAVFSPNSKTHIMYKAEQAKQNYIKYYQTQEERFHLLTPGIFRDRVAPENFATVHKKIREAYQLDDSQRLILQIGSNFKLKGVDRSLLALAELPNELRSKTLLWIVGKGNRCKYMWLARKFGVAKNIRFLGLTDEISKLLLAADLFLHPAYREAAGMVIVEAIVAGLPVLTTASCGYAYHVKRAKAGLVVPLPFKQETLNKCLHNMLVSGKLSEWRKNGIAYGRTEDLYSRDKAVEIIEMAASEHLAAAK
jgi:UDP-glucose:(heptosyl)LPS alpha-1,3-glucosyltransferase